MAENFNFDIFLGFIEFQIVILIEFARQEFEFLKNLCFKIVKIAIFAKLDGSKFQFQCFQVCGACPILILTCYEGPKFQFV